MKECNFSYLSMNHLIHGQFPDIKYLKLVHQFQNSITVFIMNGGGGIVVCIVTLFWNRCTSSYELKLTRTARVRFEFIQVRCYSKFCCSFS